MTLEGSGSTNSDLLVDEIFDRALDLPPGERSTYLDLACGQDTGLRARVERLLAFSDNPPSMLDGSLAADLWTPEELGSSAEPGPPARVGPYQLLEEIGRGGMGVVYLGVRADGHFEQKVAVKVMRPGSETLEARRRFEQERQIVASLQHTNIARLYDGGVTDSGQPYSAMELIEGRPITEYCDEHRLSIVERLRLVEVVGSAVAYAHQKLVVHCDLKPSNILVTSDGEIKLLDFGIAKLLDVAGSPTGSASDTRGITPLYASPEQLRGELVTTASDIYQLGLLLFELLTGERARQASPESGSGSGTTSETAPRRAPSTAVRQATGERATAAAAARDTRPRTLVRSLRHDLDLIVQAAMHEEPERRYLSAAALVEDLKRYRRHQPLTVRSPTFTYRAGRFLRRHRWGMAGATLLLLLLVGYSITVTVQAQRIRQERDRAQRIQAFALGLYSAGDPNLALGPELSAADLVAHGVARAEEELAEEPDVQAEVKTQLSHIYLRLGLHDRAETLLRDVLTMRRSWHGESHPQVATAQAELGRLLLERDDPEAMEMLESALAQRRRWLGEEHPDTIRTLTHLAFYLRSVGRRQEAEQHFREALRLQRLSAPESTGVANILSGLGWTIRQLRRPEEAEPMLREALAINQRLLGDKHPEVAASWNNLANVLWQLERWQEGDESMERAIESKKALYGEAHPKIASSLGNLAGSLSRRGKLERAATLYRQALEMRQELFGTSHPRVAQSLAQLAEVLHNSGSSQEAESLFQQSISIFEEHLPEGHPSFSRVFRGLGTVWLEAGQLEKARQMLQRSRAIYASIDSTSPWPWRVDVLLAEIDRRQGRLDNARNRLQGAEGKLGEGPKWLERWYAGWAAVAPETSGSN